MRVCVGVRVGLGVRVGAGVRVGLGVAVGPAGVRVDLGLRVGVLVRVGVLLGATACTRVESAAPCVDRSSTRMTSIASRMTAAAAATMKRRRKTKVRNRFMQAPRYRLFPLNLHDHLPRIPRPVPANIPKSALPRPDFGTYGQDNPACKGVSYFQELYNISVTTA